MSEPVPQPSVTSEDDPTPQVIAPVVATMVVHEPGDWFPAALDGLARQDYPSLQCLILVSGLQTDPSARAILDAVETNLPNAVVRFLGANVGFAAASNIVLQLVEGESGYFCFLHDDVDLAPNAITEMVREMFRSNAGVAGPKLLQWDNPKLIQSVGIAVDRWGVAMDIADEGELDQEQHDAVQDMFALSSACIMIRADLMRTIGGFESTLTTVGADVDLCWRAHTAGARVMVVPAAVARHRLRASSNDNEPISSDAYVRVRTVMALTSGASIVPVFLQLFVYAVMRGLVLLLTGRPRAALDEIFAVASAPVAASSIRDRRARISAYRSVSNSEVRALQMKGSADVISFLRRRERRAGFDEASQASGIAESQQVREQGRRATVWAWTMLAVLLLVGSRRMFLHGVTSVGQFAPFNASGSALWHDYFTGWWSAGFGQATALPTGVLLVAVSSLVTLGREGLLHTLLIVLLPLVGWFGAWKFSAVLSTRAARVATTLAYAAVPLPYGALAAGRWSALVVYALFPWIMYLLGAMVGHVSVARIPNDVDADGFNEPSPQRRLKLGASLVLVVAICTAFAPSIVVLLAISSTLWAIVTAVRGAKVQWAVRWITSAVIGVLGAIALNLAWIIGFIRKSWWDTIVGTPVVGGRNAGLLSLLEFKVGPWSLGIVSVLLFAVPVGAVLVVRGARAPWASRGALLAGVSLLVATLDDKALFPVHLAEPAILLVPVAFGIAVCAGTLGASLTTDLRRGAISWRQPLGALVSLAFVVALVPPVVNAVGGSWHQPSTSIPQLMEQLPTAATDGDYRTLFIGDSRVLPGTANNLGWGISYSVVTGRNASLVDQWRPTSTRAVTLAESALRGIVRGTTARSGRLLAPLSVRYVVVPIVDGATSTHAHRIPAPTGLVDALSRQLDLKRMYASPDLVIYQNASWVPVRSMLTADGAASSQNAGATSMIGADISGATSVLATADASSGATAQVPAGTLHLSVPFSGAWSVKVDGKSVAPRPAFGVTTAFDIPTSGRASLTFEGSFFAQLMVLVQVLLWGVLVVIAFRRPRRARPLARAGTVGSMEPVFGMQSSPPIENNGGAQ